MHHLQCLLLDCMIVLSVVIKDNCLNHHNELSEIKRKKKKNVHRKNTLDNNGYVICVEKT